MKPSRGKAMCLPFGTQDEYLEIVKSAVTFRSTLIKIKKQYPELFPPDFDNGFILHEITRSIKLDIPLRWIKINATGNIFLVRPSFVMPYCVSTTDEIEKPLYLRRWGASFDELSYIFGRSPKHYERALASIGRNSIVDSTIKDANSIRPGCRWKAYSSERWKDLCNDNGG